MNLDRWTTFTKSQQLLMIGSEIMRAQVWQGKDDEKFRGAIERGLTLADLTLRDPKWAEDAPMIEGLRDEMGKFLNHERTDDIQILYAAL